MMPPSDVYKAAPKFEKLAALIVEERNNLLARWREQVRELPSAKGFDAPTLEDHVPGLLDELAQAWLSVSEETIADALLEGSPPIHGRQRLRDGFDIVEVVGEYNILRGCVHDLAERHGINLQGKAFHILNRVFDEAIGLAVQTFATQQALEVQRRREEYLAFVAHDLKTPLNAISLAAESLSRESVASGSSPEMARMLKTLQRNQRRLGALVEHVLKESDHVCASSCVTVSAREFDLWPLVENVIRDLAAVAETARTRISNTVPDDLIAYGDAALVRRVFQNLLTNAINFTPRGQVTLGARHGEAGGSIECWVEDNGAGIPADRLPIIFEKGETTAPDEGATGLGLSIVKTFVEAHGGTVTVQSKEGLGSVFRFTLPGRVE